MSGIPQTVFTIPEVCAQCGTRSRPVGASLTFDPDHTKIATITLDYVCTCGWRWTTAFRHDVLEGEQ